MKTPITLAVLRQYAIQRTLFNATSLSNALNQLNFIQIDPISAPAPAQDLILRQRVVAYKKGDLERLYSQIEWEEAFFINHGYIPRELATILWSNKPPSNYLSTRTTQVKNILTFARNNAEIHPKILNAHINAKTSPNNWGSMGQEGTQIMRHMLYSGMLRIVRREKGLRIYGQPIHNVQNIKPAAIVEAAIQALAHTYAPFNHSSLVYMMRLFRQSRPDLKPHIQTALQHVHVQLAHTELDGHRWYWPIDESPRSTKYPNLKNTVRLLTPFDPLVWDRTRFERFWGWTYKFEAYKLAKQRQLGYYALPLLWREHCIGWGNLSVIGDVLHANMGYIGPKPSTKVYQRALEKELADFVSFMGCRTWLIID